VSTNRLVSTDSVSKYSALMVNCIWFTDEKCSSCQHLATWRHKIGCLAIQKLIHLISGVCWCIVLLKCVKVKLSPPHKCEKWSFWTFLGYSVKTATVCINKPDKVRHRRRTAIQQVCQHQLQQTSLYSQHTMTSLLRHD